MSYSPRLPPGETYRARLLRELEGRIDLSRLDFLGRIGYADYLALLRRSSVHVYLTYPFVLSWSLLDAMACECLVVASDTAPVRDVVRDGNRVSADLEILPDDLRVHKPYIDAVTYDSPTSAAEQLEPLVGARGPDWNRERWARL
mgnify:CR=1 FL=1